MQADMPEHPFYLIVEPSISCRYVFQGQEERVAWA